MATKRDCNLDMYRCLCMLGIVCTHAFVWCDDASRISWALSCPSLVGFVLISAWFGINFRLVKIVRLLGLVVFYVAATLPFSGGSFILHCKGHWYVWAYVFMMMFSPIIDTFAEKCSDRKALLRSFAAIAVLLWIWCPLSVLEPFSRYVPRVVGFDDCSGVVLLCIYILMRLIRRLEWMEWLESKPVVALIAFAVSGVFVAVGFRHMHSIFAFAFALSILVLIKKVPLNDACGRFFAFVTPSMFSVYLLHIPFGRYFNVWERAIYAHQGLPHVACQFALALMVLMIGVMIDIPRRLIVRWLLKWIGQRAKL